MSETSGEVIAMMSQSDPHIKKIVEILGQKDTTFFEISENLQKEYQNDILTTLLTTLVLTPDSVLQETSIAAAYCLSRLIIERDVYNSIISLSPQEPITKKLFLLFSERDCESIIFFITPRMLLELLRELKKSKETPPEAINFKAKLESMKDKRFSQNQADTMCPEVLEFINVGNNKHIISSLDLDELERNLPIPLPQSISLQPQDIVPPFQTPSMEFQLDPYKTVVEKLMKSGLTEDLTPSEFLMVDDMFDIKQFIQQSCKKSDKFERLAGVLFKYCTCGGSVNKVRDVFSKLSIGSQYAKLATELYLHGLFGLTKKDTNEKSEKEVETNRDASLTDDEMLLAHLGVQQKYPTASPLYSLFNLKYKPHPSNELYLVWITDFVKLTLAKIKEPGQSNSMTQANRVQLVAVMFLDMIKGQFKGSEIEPYGTPVELLRVDGVRDLLRGFCNSNGDVEIVKRLLSSI